MVRYLGHWQWWLVRGSFSVTPKACAKRSTWSQTRWPEPLRFEHVDDLLARLRIQGGGWDGVSAPREADLTRGVAAGQTLDQEARGAFLGVLHPL